MKASLFAIAVFATIAFSSAIDEECVQRQLRGLPMHWHNPTTCTSFYRCTNKNVRRSVACPEGREYNSKTGRCGPVGRKFCKLSLKAALDETTNVCADVLSGTSVADSQSCRSFNICNQNLAYPQTCNAGSYFETSVAACVPDTNITCWENLCLSQNNGISLADTNDCYKFYVCTNKVAVAQDCPAGSYFNKEKLNCQPGICPADATTVAPSTDDTTTDKTEDDTTTTSCTTTTTCATTTTSCPTTTTSCPTTTTSCPTTTTSCPTTTTSCPTTTTTCKSVPTTPSDDVTTTPLVPEEDCPSSCCDQSLCVAAEDDSTHPVSGDSSRYCVCTNQTAVCRKCVEGSEFDIAIKACVVKITSTPKDDDTTTPTTPKDDTPTPSVPEEDCPSSCCDQSLCVGAEDDSTHPVSGDSSRYCVCTNQTAVCRKCVEGSEFDTAIKACVVKNTSVTCSGGYKEGDFVANSDNCMLFYICFDGQLVEHSCALGNYYDKVSQSCQPDVDGICPECTANQATKLRNKRSVVQPRASNGQCCVGGIQDGQEAPHPTECNMKLVCCNGVLREESCGEGNYFNVALNECVKDTNNDCNPANPAECVEGIEQHPTNCSMWLKCCGGVLKEQFCGVDNIFNPVTQACEKDVNNECWPKVVNCNEEEVTTNPANCSYYYKCINGDWESEFCGKNYYYNPTIKSCEVDTNNVCWPKEASTCEGGVEEGQKIPGTNCSSYSVCCNGKLTPEYCSEGYLFNATQQKCIADTTNECWPKDDEPTCEGGVEEGQKIPGTNCSSYSICCNGELKPEFCAEGYVFNATQQKCIADTTNECWPKDDEPTCEGGVEEGQKIPGTNCSSYSICCNGELKPEFCSEGYVFNATQQKCIADTTNECWPKDDEPTCEGGVEEGQKIPGTNCSSYSICCNGELKPEFCSEGYVFNAAQQKCIADTTNECWPKDDETTCEGGVEEGQKVPGTNCSSYSICCNGELKSEFCSEGYKFNATQQKCIADTTNECWPKDDEPTCDGGVEDGQKIPGTNCSSYSICCNGELKPEFCSEGYVFNATQQKCIADTTNECWPKDDEPTCEGGVEEGQKIPGTNCSSYSICCNGELKPEFCSEGYVFNATQQKCIADTTNECWPKDDEPTCDGGVEDGQKIPGTNCSSYSICCNGELKPEFCSEGYVFNATQQKCIADTTNECWPKDDEPTCEGGVEEGQKIPGTNCSSYSICCNGELKPEFCSEGYVFNATQQKCIADTTNECWPKDDEPTCEGGVEEGQKVPGTNCSSYSVCCNGQLKPEFCLEGYVFNATQQKCIVDTTNKCWPKDDETTCEGGVEEGQKVPGTNCSSYSVCCNGQLKPEFCLEGYVFNATQQKCIVDTTNKCWPKDDETTCEGGVEEGQKIPGTNCSSYSVCCNGQLKPEFCLEGYVFNATQQKCIVDTTNKCWPKDDETTCEGGVEEGQKVPGTNCSSYSVCCNGQLNPEFCLDGYYFNVALQACQVDSTNNCWSKPDSPCTSAPVCIEGEQIPIPGNYCSYQVCCSSQWKEKSCAEGYYFDGSQCTLDINNLCKEDDDSCTEGDQIQNPANCSSYYGCCGGVYKEKFCEIGYYFSPTAKCCVEDTNSTCWINPCANEVNGTWIADPYQCNAYLICIGGKPNKVVCDTGDWFNPVEKACQPDLTACCYNPCANEDKLTLLPHPECNKFYLCNGKQATVETCSVGGFDITTGQCNANMPCAYNQCANKTNYYIYADPDSKQNFYVCISGVPNLKQCPENTEFNGMVCARISDVDCNATICETAPNYSAHPTLNLTETEAFCLCSDGHATKEYCPPQYTFNTTMGTCYSNAPCDPMICKVSADFTIFENRNDTSSFCMCLDNEAVIVKCPSGSFNPYSLTCTNVEISNQCDQLICRSESDNYVYQSNNASANGFCVCDAHVGVYNECPEGSVFNTVVKVCKKDNINCDSTKCQGVSNSTKLPALTTNQGYCECNGDNATYYECENYGEFNATTQQCQEPACPHYGCVGEPDDYSFAASNTTQGFCLCQDSVVKYMPCLNEGTFDPIMKVCKVPLKNCDDNMCVNESDNTKLPSWNTIYGYCKCLNCKPIYEDCADGLVFNSTAQVCDKEDIPIENLCDTTVCANSANTGAVYPSTSNIHGYCTCCSDQTKFVYCNNSEVFDSTTLQCRPTAETECDLALCCNASPENIYSTPAKNNDSYFCLCSGPDNVILMQCPVGTYDAALQLCVQEIEEGSSCPAGVQNGDLIADPNNCNQYFICNSGCLQQKCCPTGQYFNSDCNECLPGTCAVTALLAEYSCLGAYHEGEQLPHPYNEQMFYVCEQSQLHERNCGNGRIFDYIRSQCIKDPRKRGRFMHKRSVDVNEFICISDEKRSVPSNCSQYEVCTDHMWQRHTCSQSRYYNPEQQKCLEPRDDTICAYAKVSMLPICSAAMEQRTHKAKICQQYFLCQEHKWRLRKCSKQEYYNEQLATCLPHGLGNDFDCKLLANTSIAFGHLPATQCQHLAVRTYEKSCAMYLMCMENKWWYQYCPLDMYFNRTLNYCIPIVGSECPEAIRSIKVTAVENFVNESCTQESSLRPSALACNRFYVCIAGKWLQQQCMNGEFYDPEQHRCLPDAEGICAQLQMDCLPQQKRAYPFNCSAYEECSSDGRWSKLLCPRRQIFDELQQQCVSNDGICSSRGLKRVCNVGEMRKVATNCTQFYFCVKDNWTLGNCLLGHMYWEEQNMCVPHRPEDQCQRLHDNNPVVNQDIDDVETNPCEDKPDGTSVSHPTDCSKYHVCVADSTSQELQCVLGSFFDSNLQYCRPNDGTCEVPLTGVCENASNGSLVSHPTDCQAYYSCSTLTGPVLMNCPLGQYYHNYTRQCRMDHGECKGSNGNDGALLKCLNATHGTRLPHERYCNLYYACVKGLAIPVECPENYMFNVLLGKCVADLDGQCQDGQLVNDNQSYSCGNLSDGSYIADRKDCTRYYICSNGLAQPKRCAGSTFFDSELSLCIPDDGSCPYVDEDEPNQLPVPPDPIVCEGKHGYLMGDPMNCNNFYVCINEKLRHERCNPEHFFNTTDNQCHPVSSISDNDPIKPNSTFDAILLQTPKQSECSDQPTSVSKICEEYPDGTTIAEQGDCRLYITCQVEEEPISQRCRNGDSYDSLLGFCRQNDGTCLLENGQRVGECNDRHGQLARDSNNCRNYFVCINGQKIAQSCEDYEYFSKSQNMCINDTLNTCNPEIDTEDTGKQSCKGLSESVLYPYINDNCRSYFQCVKGVAKISQCADDLYFDPIAIKCVLEKTECIMPKQSWQKIAAKFKKQTNDQICIGKNIDEAYGNIENNCRTFYRCLANGETVYEMCPLGMAFDRLAKECVMEQKVICV